MAEKPTLFLLLAQHGHPDRDFIAVNLAGMCREKGILFDAYYAAGDENVFVYRGGGHIHAGETGGLFSGYGSMLLGGRHHQVLARTLAQFDTTILRLGEVSALGSLVHASACPVLEAAQGLELLEMSAKALDMALPKQAVLVQTQQLPSALAYGLAQYVFPEAISRQALLLPLELPETDMLRVTGWGMDTAWTLATADADLSAWKQAGVTLETADTLAPDETYLSLTTRIAERWQEQATGFDMTEPGMAAFWLPYAIRENRLPVCGESMADASARIAPLVKSKENLVVYGRYAGGPICGADDDTDLFALFEQDISYEVIEPRRPVLTVLSAQPAPMPQPTHAPFDLEPPDEQLEFWAERGFILTTLVFHSGELSHDDAMFNIMDISALTQVRVGLPAHVQRYTFEPDCIEPMHIPVEEGGVLGLCEPMLHSTGYGILAEAFADPKTTAQMMRAARDEIAAVAGERFAPRGVYCYLDARPPHWTERPEALWQAIADAGFEYVVSSVQPGLNDLLYRDSDFVVLNISSPVYYPYSPFVRANSVSQLVAMERQLSISGRPGWLLTVLDTPIFAYTNYLLKGKSRPTEAKPLLFGNEAAFGSFYEYILSKGEMSKLVSATPHTIARYARLIQDMGLI